MSNGAVKFFLIFMTRNVNFHNIQRTIEQISKNTNELLKFQK
jgi:hypothetical protein